MDPLLILLLLASGASAVFAASSDGYFRFPPPPSPPILFTTPASPPPPPPPPLPLPCYISADCGDVVQLVPKVNDRFCLTGSQDGSVFMTVCDETSMYQFWRKDDSWGGSFEDSSGYKAFTLVNLATNMALRHGVYENERVDSCGMQSIQGGFLWTMSELISDKYATIRSCQNIDLNLDVDHGDKKRGGVKEHNPLILFEWTKGENQLWKMLRYVLV